ncbi:MAG: laminin B domain-containing protein [Myxococcota bacterium]
MVELAASVRYHRSLAWAFVLIPNMLLSCTYPIEEALLSETQPDTGTGLGAYKDPIVSDFEQGEEGWFTINTGSISHESSGGSSGAYATAVTDGSDYWVAPDAFLGQLSDAYGHSLRFSRRVEEPGYSNQPDVLLISARGMILEHTFTSDTPSTWTAYKVALDDTEWFHSDGEEATAQELKDVLSELSLLLINTDAYWLAEGSCDLDEVKLEAKRSPNPLPDGIQSTFDADEEEWTTLWDNQVRWDAGDETRGGYISQESGADYWVAPRSFVGNRLDAYGRDLTFERRTDVPGGDYQKDVILTAEDGTELYYEFSFHPLQVWTRFTVRLKENGWTNQAGEPAKTSEMKGVLSELSKLRISTGGDWLTTGTHALDNVAIDLP